MQILQLTDMTNLIKQPLSDIQRKSLISLITQDVHYRDITEALCNS